MATVVLSKKPPKKPQADFAFSIDFQKGEGSASRVFAATHEFIRACEKLDRELVSMIDANIETVLVLEDIEVGSIKTWLRSVLVTADDSALRELDRKKIVGEYLVKAKYAYLQWSENENPERDLPTLSRELQRIATEANIRRLPHYRPPTPAALLDVAKDIQSAKQQLLEGKDKAMFITEQGSLEMKLSMRWDIESLEALAVRETIKQPNLTLVLIVKKPDYLGDSRWELRLGKRNIQAHIEDVDWLKRFQAREIDVRPGDALRCDVTQEHLIGHDNELLSERYIVTRVREVLVNRYNQGSLFDS
ncbi:MAG: hypothetical protein ACK5XX_08240 [Holosporales bacterium]